MDIISSNEVCQSIGLDVPLIRKERGTLQVAIQTPGATILTMPHFRLSSEPTGPATPESPAGWFRCIPTGTPRGGSGGRPGVRGEQDQYALTRLPDITNWPGVPMSSPDSMSVPWHGRSSPNDRIRNDLRQDRAQGPVARDRPGLIWGTGQRCRSIGNACRHGIRTMETWSCRHGGIFAAIR